MPWHDKVIDANLNLAGRTDLLNDNKPPCVNSSLHAWTPTSVFLRSSSSSLMTDDKSTSVSLFNLCMKGYFQFEIIINVLVRSFCFIWIPMLWGYSHYNFF